jgi:hypothetical protein
MLTASVTCSITPGRYSYKEATLRGGFLGNKRIMFPVYGHDLAPLATLHISQPPEEQYIMDKGVSNIVIVVLIVACVLIYILWKNSRKTKDAIILVAQQHDLIRHDERTRTLCRAIHILNPNVTAGVDYVLRHETPEQEPYIAAWLTNTYRPTEEEINSALLEISDVHHESKYATMRRKGYPSVEEQLDAAYQARQGNDTKQLEVDEKIRLIKEKYPKTDECV